MERFFPYARETERTGNQRILNHFVNGKNRHQEKEKH